MKAQSMYDLAIIGAGWAGFNAALRAKKLGLKVCLIEGNQIGGTCLNRGCIPTKALIQSAKAYSLAKKISVFGIELENLHINFSKIQERKDKIVKLLGQGMQSRLVGIDFIKSYAKIVSLNEIKVADGIIKSKFILIAIGSEPAAIPGLAFDQEKVITSSDILSLTEIPQSLLIIGGGVIGCEFASLFSILGAQVTIAEKMSRLLPTEDREVSRKIEVIFKKKGIKVVTGVDRSSFDLEIYSKILVCVGRVPNTKGLGLENLGIELKNNSIVVDDYLKSSQDNIYAAGDCTAKVMLAHYAAYQGERAVDNMISSFKLKADHAVIPSCIFTDPEIASVGLNEDQALKAGLVIKVHKFDFLGSGMAHIMDETEGFIKVISDDTEQKIIGATIIGPKATELIATLSVAVRAHLKVSQVRDMIFAHPTLSESIRESLN
ncbi:MAG: dihydrolipoyl dehydrogenase [Candidatus Omnitrophica bacterium]|nr:dihydrolipoyl dehydrogenase [Candidatus Omnitrophota bacterium]